MNVVFAYDIRKEGMLEMILRHIQENKNQIKNGAKLAGQGWQMLKDWPHQGQATDLWVQIAEYDLDSLKPIRKFIIDVAVVVDTPSLSNYEI